MSKCEIIIKICFNLIQDMKLGRNLARTFLDYYKLQNHIVFNPSTSVIPKLNNTSLINYKNLPNTSLLASANLNTAALNINNGNGSSTNINSSINNNNNNNNSNSNLAAISTNNAAINQNGLIGNIAISALSNSKMSNKRSPTSLTAQALKPIATLAAINPNSSSSLSTNSSSLNTVGDVNSNGSTLVNPQQPQPAPKPQAQAKFLVENSFD